MPGAAEVCFILPAGHGGQAANTAHACGMDMKSNSFRHSSSSRPFKLSTHQLWIGFPGAMHCHSKRRCRDQRKIKVNSVPLSLITASELLRSAIITSGSRLSLATDSCAGFDYRNWRGFDYRHRRNMIQQNSIDDWEDAMKGLEGVEWVEYFVA